MLKTTKGLLEDFKNFAANKGYVVKQGSDWGQRHEKHCSRSIRIAAVLSPKKIKLLEEGTGIYEVDLETLKEVEGSLSYKELYEKLYEDKCKG